MAALDYAGLEAAIVAILQADVRLVAQNPTVTIDNGQGSPTADMCPFVGVSVTGFEREPKQLVGGIASGGPYLETIGITLDCWEFSGQGGSDARALCYALVDTVLSVLADNPTVGGRVMLAQALRGQITTDRAAQGVFSRALLEMQAQKFTP